METSPKLAKLSIIVISVSSHSSLRNCLESIFANENQDKIEIIVALNPTDNSPSDLINQYPKVRFLYLPGKAGIPILMAAAIAQSA